MIKKILTVALIVGLTHLVFADGNEPVKSKNVDVPTGLNLFVKNYWKSLKENKLDLIHKEDRFDSRLAKDIAKIQDLSSYKIKYTHYQEWKTSKNEKKFAVAFDLLDENKNIIKEEYGCYIVLKEKLSYKFSYYLSHCLEN